MSSIVMDAGQGSASTTPIGLNPAPPPAVPLPVTAPGIATAKLWDGDGTRPGASVAPAPSLLDARALGERLAIEVERAVRYARPLAILVVDLGGARAQGALVEAAIRTLRKVDFVGATTPGEIVVILPETRDTARVPARRLLASLHAAAPLARGGLARCPLDAPEADVLLAIARREAMRAAPGAVASRDDAHARRIGDMDIVARDPAMTKLLALVERLAASDIPVIVSGETGAGKEVVARALHEWSPRRYGRLVSINCAAVPDALLESELFGHERGAFSGAVQAKPGLLESAEGGTVFLDEIGECSLGAQAKLLRALETRRVVRLGSVTERSIDVRIVAATNRSLDDEVAAGRFRQDLLFRLDAAAVHVPPLRARPRDLEALARMFLDEACAREGRAPMVLAPGAIARLGAHRWPGNVRELRNVITYVAAVCTGSRVEEHDLPERILTRSGQWKLDIAAVPSVATPPAPAQTRVWRNLYDEIRDLERTRIAEALEETRGVRIRAAELIGIPLRTLVTKIREYGLSSAGSRKPPDDDPA